MSSTEVSRTVTRVRPDARELRRFGLTVGGVFGALALWPLVVRGASPRWWALALAVGLVLPAVVAPGLLAPANRLWMSVGEALGWINTRILLGAVCFLMLTPMGLIMRWLGKDPMRRGFDPNAATYCVSRRPRPATHMTRQF